MGQRKTLLNEKRHKGPSAPIRTLHRHRLFRRRNLRFELQGALRVFGRGLQRTDAGSATAQPKEVLDSARSRRVALQQTCQRDAEISRTRAAYRVMTVTRQVERKLLISDLATAISGSVIEVLMRK